MKAADDRPQFIKDIRRLFPKEVVESSFWITKKGFFLKTECRDTLVDSYLDWKISTGESVVAPARIDAVEHLFGSRDIHEYYLILGNVVVVGVLVELATQDLRGVGIRLYEGIPVDTHLNLHQKDPMFFQNEELTCEHSSQGFALRVRVKGFEFRLGFDTVSALRTFLVNHREIRTDFDLSGARNFARCLPAVLGKMRPLGRKRFIVYPARVKQLQSASLFACGDLALVQQDGVIVDFFPSRRRGYSHMIREELQRLGADKNSRNIGGAQLSVGEGSFVASIEISGIRHKMGVSAINSFLEASDLYGRIKRGRLPGKLPQRPSVRDVVGACVRVVKGAQPVMPEKIPTRLKTERAQGAQFLCSEGEWFLQVDRNKMIREIHFIPKPKKQEITPFHYSNVQS